MIAKILTVDEAFDGPKKKHTNFGVLSPGVDPQGLRKCDPYSSHRQHQKHPAYSRMFFVV